MYISNIVKSWKSNNSPVHDLTVLKLVSRGSYCMDGSHCQGQDDANHTVTHKFIKMIQWVQQFITIISRYTDLLPSLSTCTEYNNSASIPASTIQCRLFADVSDSAARRLVQSAINTQARFYESLKIVQAGAGKQTKLTN